jgi:phenylpyruvate tautomerase PptA (4-oxalocrotonate tautomerase family)
MADVYTPPRPLTDEQKAQLVADIADSIAAATPMYADTEELWTVIYAMYALLLEPAPIPDPPTE